MLSDKLERLSASERHFAGHKALGKEHLDDEREEGDESTNANQKVVPNSRSSGLSRNRLKS